jgi:hypothetical protein
MYNTAQLHATQGHDPNVFLSIFKLGARAQPFDTKPSNNNNLRVIMTVVGDQVDPRSADSGLRPAKSSSHHVTKMTFGPSL